MIRVQITVHREPWPMIAAQIGQWERRPGIDQVLVSVNPHTFEPTAPWSIPGRTRADVDRERAELVERYQIREEPLADAAGIAAAFPWATVETVPPHLGQQTDLLNAVAERASEDGVAWLSIWDADEFLTDEQWRDVALDMATRLGGHEAAVIVPNRDYVVDLEHRLIPDDTHWPAILVRPGGARFRRRRLIGCRGGRIATVAWRVHASWVGTENALRFKLVRHAHFAEITPAWKTWVLDRETEYPPDGCGVYPRTSSARVIVEPAPAEIVEALR